jgi:hypothetical protein
MEQLSQDAIIEHYTAIAFRPPVLPAINLINDNHLSAHDVGFLNELKPLIDKNTDDSRMALNDLIRGTSEKDVRFHLYLQEILGDISYRYAAAFAASFSIYIGKGMIRKPKKVFSDPQKLIALFRVKEALMETASDVPYRDRPVEDQGVPYIKDKDLIAFILDNAEHAQTIDEIIRTRGVLTLPEIEHHFHGRAPALSNGAL